MGSEHPTTELRTMTERAMRLAPALIAALLLATLTGCEAHVVRSGWDDFNQTPGAGRDAAPTSPADLSPDANWAIAADVFAGASHRTLAQQRVGELQRASGMAGFWALDEGGKSTVLFGRYKTPQQPEATRDLDKLRKMAQSGQLRVATLMLVPLTTAADASGGPIGEHDLRSAIGRGVYTLQIGFYEGGPEAKKAAEDAVAALRKDGEQAFYYHGPNRSMVTVGLFGDDAILSTTEGNHIQTAYAAFVKALQEKFPYNTVNGRAIEETRQGKTTKQPSFLVRIPKAG